MFVGPKTVKEFNADGSSTQKISMTYSWRSKDWNRFLRPDTIDWDIPKDSGGKTVYEYADFQALLNYFR